MEFCSELISGAVFFVALIFWNNPSLNLLVLYLYFLIMHLENMDSKDFVIGLNPSGI